MRSTKLTPKKRRLVICSNRLPVSLAWEHDAWQVRASAGGLVTAMGPVLRNRGGLWIGWPGVVDVDNVQDVLDHGTRGIGYSLVPVPLTAEEEHGFYHGFSNEVLWPLFHSLQQHCNYDATYWQAYQKVNDKFAEVIAAHLWRDDDIWIHDYHLMSVGAALRRLGVSAAIGFFLHIPFPPSHIFQKLPWRREILESLMHFDLIGFQTPAHRHNFLESVRYLFNDASINVRGALHRVTLRNNTLRVGSFPISIDYKSFASQTEAPDVQHLVDNVLREVSGTAVMLGVDRLDYTKGIPGKMRAFRRALELYPELRRKITLLQVVVPSRGEIPEYYGLKEEIDRLVGEIGGEFSEPGWTPIVYMYRSLTRQELLAYYRASRIALITPLEDGMNLVAKEYCACSDQDNSVLILSEFAGAAQELGVGALLVNPNDMDGLAEAIRAAYTMKLTERR
ncbi:MAG TPA: trehalose-6-phosphate synthase, partial [Candidatus Acidoferrales bacterium]